MDDMISRAAVLARFKALQEYDPEHEGRGYACNFLNDSREPSTEWYCVEDVVENMPAVDAAPVVRCRICKWGSVTTDKFDKDIVVYCNNPDCAVWDADMAVKPDWYCAYGERRDEE